MTTASKLMGFAIGITLVFSAAYAIGAAIGPIGEAAPAHADHSGAVAE